MGHIVKEHKNEAKLFSAIELTLIRPVLRENLHAPCKEGKSC